MKSLKLQSSSLRESATSFNIQTASFSKPSRLKLQFERWSSFDLSSGDWCLRIGSSLKLEACSLKFSSARASILVGLLWCLALLSVVVIGVLHTARTDMIVVKNYGDRVQAHYLALAGIEKARALLVQDARQRSHSGVSHGVGLYNAEDQFRDVTLGRGQFRVIRRGRDDEGGGIIYGVSDEESRLNLNRAAAGELGKLQNITADVLAAILDWRDEDNAVTPGGAEADYYMSQKPPSMPRNGPFQTVRELLMVRGVSRDHLFGQDTHQNGFLQASTPDGQEAATASAADAGWATMLTVDSSVNNVNAAGEDRVNVQQADENTLAGVRGLTPEIARAIVAYRGRNQFQSLADLLDVTAVQNQNQGGRGGRNQNSSGNRNQNANQTAGDVQAGRGSDSSGPTVISQDLLINIADDITLEQGGELAGVVNINTASLEVLTCLPGMSKELAQRVISHRQGNGFFSNIAGILKVQGMTTDIFKQLAPRIESRSETFRILSEGKVTSTGARQRIQAIVHVGLNSLVTVSYREDDL
jgi:DNA uptake protein ComE-like DNA-binding protein